MNTYMKQTPKQRKARERAMQLADMPATLEQPEDVERWTPEQVYEFLKECSYEWNKDTKKWEYDG